MRFYFVRHGQTEYNKAEIIQGGSVDAPLTAQGVAGAKQLGCYLADVPFTKVFTSPQQRAVDTAKYILAENESHPTVQTDVRLREIEFGEFDGKTMKEFEEAGYYQYFKHEPEKYENNPAGETYKEVTERAYACLQDIIKQSNDDDIILIVAHCITLTSLIKYLNGLEVKDYRKNGVLDNTSVTIFEYQNQEYDMIKYNYVPQNEASK